MIQEGKKSVLGQDQESSGVGMCLKNKHNWKDGIIKDIKIIAEQEERHMGLKSLITTGWQKN